MIMGVAIITLFVVAALVMAAVAEIEPHSLETAGAHPLPFVFASGGVAYVPDIAAEEDAHGSLVCFGKSAVSAAGTSSSSRGTTTSALD